MGRNNRSKGHDYERLEARALRESGLFPTAVTSRAHSKARDDQRVDIMKSDELEKGRMEYNFQCKASCSIQNYKKILESMPDNAGVINVLLHNYATHSKTGKSFVTRGIYAITHRDDFYNLMRFRRGYEIIRSMMESLPPEIMDKLKEIGL